MYDTYFAGKAWEHEDESLSQLCAHMEASVARLSWWQRPLVPSPLLAVIGFGMHKQYICMTATMLYTLESSCADFRSTRTHQE